MAQIEFELTGARPSVGARLRQIRQNVGRLVRGYPLGAIAVGVLAIVITAVLLADVLTPFERDRSTTQRLVPPLTISESGHIFWLGTDDIARDFFTRLLHGGRVSLFVGLVAPTVGITIGALVGIIGAYYGGYADLIIQRFTDVLMAIPSLILAMTITIGFGFTVPVVTVAISVGIIPYASRLLRSHALVLREAQYLEAANAIGASDWRIIFRHLMPNSFAPWIVLLAVNVGNAIVLESSLSFLGIGIAPPTPSWGNLLTRATTYFANNEHLVLAPGIIITVVVVCANLVGDSLRDLLDPRLRGSR